MPITMEIREDGWVIYFVFKDPWTIAELMPHVEEDKKFRDQSSHTVHLMMNMSAAKHLPAGAISLRHTSPDMNHATAGQVVMVGTTPLIRNIAEVVFRLSRITKFKMFATEDEGWAYLRKIIAESGPNAIEKSAT